MTILSVKADHYRIPLGVTLSDATHGEMSSFEFVTVRLETDSGLEGVGFTYTTVDRARAYARPSGFR